MAFDYSLDCWRWHRCSRRRGLLLWRDRGKRGFRMEISSFREAPNNGDNASHKDKDSAQPQHGHAGFCANLRN